MSSGELQFQVRDVFLAALVHTFHTIWLARNMIRFGRGLPQLYAAKSRIASSVALGSNISKGNVTTSGNWLMENFMIAPSFRRFKDIIPVFRKPPTPPFIKVNTDGSVLGAMLLMEEFSGTTEALFGLLCE